MQIPVRQIDPLSLSAQPRRQTFAHINRPVTAARTADRYGQIALPFRFETRQQRLEQSLQISEERGETGILLNERAYLPVVSGKRPMSRTRSKTR